MTDISEIGKIGEQKVADYLKSKGYIIVKRNWRDSRFGEIDIIAENTENVVFVEVKTRTVNSLVSGAEAVDGRKISRVKNAAEVFMQRFITKLPYRVDVAEVTYDNFGEKEIWKLHYIKNV